jgi:uncharacterized protein (TIGR02246 family)
MNKRLVTLLLLASVLLSPRLASCESREQDEAAIRNVEKQQGEAWNRHDAKAYAALFTENGDCVNVVGWWWKGRAEIEKKLTAAFAFVFRESVLTITDVDVRFPGAEMAIAHVRWSLVGARTPPNYPKVQQGIQTQMLQKQNGKWMIKAFQNTNAIPETPFPQGPPASTPATGVAMRRRSIVGLTNR